MRFVDRVRIKVRAGDGGRGMVSFLRTSKTLKEDLTVGMAGVAAMSSSLVVDASKPSSTFGLHLTKRRRVDDLEDDNK